MQEQDLSEVRALTFDVFGTIVDWRGGVMREAAEVLGARGVEADWGAFADAWRALYQPSMRAVRKGERPWIILDDLHRENLLEVLAGFGIEPQDESEVERLNLAWHRLDPWPDVVPGLSRLRRRYILATASNGNVALMVDMARHGGLPWDVILGGDVVRAYKPDSEAYLRNAEMLGLAPRQCMMVAAHEYDLKAAARCGYRTAYVPRPGEFPGYAVYDDAAAEFDVVAADFNDLADRLGC